MPTIRIGVIGCGTITQWAHLPVLMGPDVLAPPDDGHRYSPYGSSYKPPFQVEVVALCDVDGERVNVVADRCRIPARYTDWRLMLNECPLNALVVAAGHEVNAEVIPAAAAQGKHLFVEKPMTGTLREALEVAEALRGRRIVFQVGFMKRFYLANRIAKRLVNAGEIGEVQAISARFWSGYQRDLLNNGIHLFDLVQFFAGRATEVFARRRGDHVAATVTFVNGAVGTLDLFSTDVYNSVHERVEIVGANGKTLVSENGRELWLYAPSEPARRWTMPQVVHYVTGYSLAGFAEEHKHFLHCIASARPSSVGVESGVNSMRLKEGVEQALESGEVVSLR